MPNVADEAVAITGAGRRLGEVTAQRLFDRVDVLPAAIVEGPRQEVGEDIRATVISLGAVSTELTSKITHVASAEDLYSVAIDADARAISYAIDQPAGTDINEIVLRLVRDLRLPRAAVRPLQGGVGKWQVNGKKGDS